MLLYLAHKYQGDQENLKRAKNIAHDLQIKILNIALSVHY